MAYQGIGTGTTPNDNSGDSLLTGAIKINNNFQEIYTALGDGSTIDLNTDKVSEGTNLYYTDERVQDAIGAAINAGIQTGLTVTYDDANNAIDFANYTITTTSGDKLLSKFEYCTVTSGGVTLTLPEDPSVGDKVIIGIGDNYEDTVVERNGSKIMGSTDNLTIDIGYVTLTFIYINNTLGWRVS
jgi:hypothetical protein